MLNEAELCRWLSSCMEKFKVRSEPRPDGSHGGHLLSSEAAEKWHAGRGLI